MTTVFITDTLALSDKLRTLQAASGDVREFTLSTLVAFLSDAITEADDKVTQYAAPNATGFSVSVLEGPRWLILTPFAGYAAGTIVLPAVASVDDRQELLVNTTQAVTTLTVSGNGATVNGAPTTLAAGAFFRLRFDAQSTTWHRVG
jgi:hypothetical protein